MYKGIKSVIPLEDYKIRVVFENDEVKIFDVKPYLETGIFKELKDIEIFNTVRVSFDTVEWSNGADLDPEEIYECSVLSDTQVAEDKADYKA